MMKALKLISGSALTAFLFPVVYGQQELPQYRLTIDTVFLNNVTVSVTVPLDNKQIEKFYRTNYFSTIDNLTSHLDGVSLIKRGAYALEPQLNGFSGGQLNITIDGMKMFGACTDRMDPVTSYLEPANLKTITLDHGTNGSLHGNNIGGSIELSLQDPTTDQPGDYHTSLSFGYETVSNSRNLLLTTGYKKGKVAMGLNGVYRKNDPYLGGNGEKIAYSQFEKYNFHYVMRFSPDSTSGFRTDLLWDLARDVGYPALPMDVSHARAIMASAGYQKKKDLYEYNAKVYFNSILHIMDDSARDSLFFLRDELSGEKDSVIMRMDMPGWSRTFGAYFQGTIKLNSRNNLTLKADNYTNYSLAEMTMHMHFTGHPPEPPMYLQTWPGMIRSVTGLYVSNTTNLNRNLSLSVNGRIDFNADHLLTSTAMEQFSVFNYSLERNTFRVTKSLNFISRIKTGPYLMLSAQAGISERMPTLSERYGFYLYNAYDGYDYVGNPYLKTEKSFFSKITATYYHNGLKINLSQSGNFLGDYIMGVTNSLIPPMNFYTNGLRLYENINSARIFSSDLQVMYSLKSGLSFFLLSRYTRGIIDRSTNLPLMPPFRNIFSISYETGKWAFQADNETASRQNRINPGYGETRTPSFTVFNIKVNRHFMMKGMMLDMSAGISNLFDTNYYEHLDWGQIPRPGRSYSLYIKHRF